MQTVLFISENKLRSFSDVNQNLDSKLLTQGIRVSQDIEIQRILGTKLYKRLSDGIVAGNLNQDEVTLLEDYIADSLLYWAYYYILEDIYVRPRNNGLLTPTGGDNSVNVDIGLYDRKRQSAKNKAEWYSELLATYILENDGLFPELSESTKLYEKTADVRNQLTNSPFVLRGDRATEKLFKYGIKVINSRFPYLPQ